MFCFLLAGLPAVVFSYENEPVIYCEVGLFLNVGGGSVKVNDESGGGSLMRYGEFKVGYGPIDDPIFNLPIYLVGEFTGGYESSTGRSRNDVMGYSSIPLYTGVGILYYPKPIIQLGGTLGVSWHLSSSIPYKIRGRVSEDIISPGFAWNISTAADLGALFNAWKNVDTTDKEFLMGLLLGLQISGSRNSFKSYYLRDEIASGTVSTTYISAFLKTYIKIPR